MLRELLDLYRRSPGATYTLAAIAAELQTSPVMIEQLLRTLVRSGRLVEVEHCADCGDCPLTWICVGGLAVYQRGYSLAPPKGPA